MNINGLLNNIIIVFYNKKQFEELITFLGSWGACKHTIVQRSPTFLQWRPIHLIFIRYATSR